LGDFGRFWAILGDFGRFWAIFSQTHPATLRVTSPFFNSEHRHTHMIFSTLKGEAIDGYGRLKAADLT
jgi:hypothetical protein